MDQLMGELLKVLVATIVSGVVLYIGIVNKLRSQLSVHDEKINKLEENCKDAQHKFEEVNHKLAVIEEKTKHVEQRQDSHSKKNDEIISLITDFKLEMAKKIGDVSIQMGKISSDVENINSTIAIFDDGIRSKKRKKSYRMVRRKTKEERRSLWAWSEWRRTLGHRWTNAMPKFFRVIFWVCSLISGTALAANTAIVAGGGTTHEWWNDIYPYLLGIPAGMAFVAKFTQTYGKDGKPIEYDEYRKQQKSGNTILDHDNF